MFTKSSISRSVSILFVFVFVLGLAGRVETMQYSPAKLSKAVETMPLLQYTSGGHVLGFSPQGMYAATGSHALRVEFVDANPVTPLGAVSNSQEDRHVAPQLASVTYPNLWNGVTLTYDSVGIVRSTYRIEPYADPAAIRLYYNQPVAIQPDGSLHIQFESGLLMESAPVAWQEINEERMTVEVTFTATSQNEIGFVLGAYNTDYSLHIDPTLVWNTFLGGSGYYDYGRAIAVDEIGSIYVIGSSDASWGSPTRAQSGGNDAVVSKLDSSGALIWNTFLGGSGYDEGYDIDLDEGGNVFVAGNSSATWGSPVQAYTVADGFAAKLDGTSGALIWNTFLGGSGGDQARGIASDGDVYVTGYSTAAWGTPQRAYTAGNDAFVAKLNSSGVLTWNTFLGGGQGDEGHGVAIDGSGNIYIAGQSFTTWGSPVRAYTGAIDFFVAKLDSSGAPIWNTFLGGGSFDYATNGIAVDGAGNVYVTGYSLSSWGSPIRANSGGPDGFAAKLSSSGMLTWSTFLGGSGPDVGFDISVDGGSNIYVAGYSSSTWGNPMSPYTSGIDTYIAKLDSSGILTSNTFVGGSGGDVAYGLDVDSSRNIYVTGNSDAAWGSPLRAYTHGNDAFVVKVNLAPSTRYVATTGVDTGDCGNPTSPCATIAYAISQAVAGNTIEIAAGTYTEAGITVDKDLTLTGAGASSTIVQAAPSPSLATDRVFLINNSISVTIDAVTIQNGRCDGACATRATYGGGILNSGTLTLNRVIVSSNSASHGGGIFNNLFSQAVLTINDSTVIGNSASYGGGIYNSPNTITTVNSSAVIDNSAVFDGGGIVVGGSNVYINTSTISGNTANTGGGISIASSLEMKHSTVTNNTSDPDNDGSGGGGGIINHNHVNLYNSIIAGNKKGTSGATDPAADCVLGGGPTNSLGYNLTGNGTGCNFNGIGDVTINPVLVFTDVLAPLADNGGATQTHALFVSSSNPALNAIPIGGNDCGLSPFNFDQRGEARPFGTLCDIGAYEAQSAPPIFLDQTITVIRYAPTGARFGDIFTVEAVASSGLPVIYNSSGACSNVGDTFTMVVAFGSCTVYFDQAGDDTYNPAPQVVQIVGDANDVPVIDQGVSLSMIMSEDGSGIVGLIASDEDVSDTLTWSLANAPLHGAVSIQASAPPAALSPEGGIKVRALIISARTLGAVMVHYEPVPDYNGFDSFIVEVSDGNGGIDRIRVNVTINPVNDAPILTEGDIVDVTMSEDGDPTPFALTLHATDVDGDSLNWIILPSSGPLHGLAGVIGSGDSASVDYAPEPNYFGTDSFVVSVDDGFDRDTITVNVTIELVNEVPSLNTLNPASAQIGSADLTLNISGTDFAPGAIVRWHNGATSTITDLDTTFISASSLSAVVPAILLTTAGTFEVSVFNPAPGGGGSASLPFFVTQSNAAVTSSDTAVSTDPGGTAVASTGGSGAGTPGSITASGTGVGSISVSQYDSNPTGTSTFTSAGGYFDVYVSQGSSFSTITIVACNMSGNAKIRWWDDGSWIQVSPQTNNNGCVTMELSDTSTPTVAELTGTIFGVEGFTFSGFLSPVDNPGTVNIGKAGRTYPIKWQLKNGDGLFISDLAAISSITYTSHSCTAFTGDPTDALETTAAGDTNLRFDSATNQFIYNWKTPGVGCYTLFVTLDTGQVYYAYFNLK